MRAIFCRIFSPLDQFSFWLGMNTGLKSYRCKVFDKFPRTNIPDYFPSWGEYENLSTC